ncbi:hypothetical protein ABXV03_19720, partial [Streptomyces harbinensis]|uniref:hypothetical protein n=1 Tax=Streptomyces harbinensis TaxID=1176198 RepID=UPI0033949928
MPEPFPAPAHGQPPEGGRPEQQGGIHDDITGPPADHHRQILARYFISKTTLAVTTIENIQTRPPQQTPGNTPHAKKT